MMGGVTSTAACAAAIAFAVVAFGFAMWASTSEEGAPAWRNHASLISAFLCVAALGIALTAAEG